MLLCAYNRQFSHFKVILTHQNYNRTQFAHFVPAEMMPYVSRTEHFFRICLTIMSVVYFHWLYVVYFIQIFIKLPHLRDWLVLLANWFVNPLIRITLMIFYKGNCQRSLIMICIYKLWENVTISKVETEKTSETFDWKLGPSSSN